MASLYWLTVKLLPDCSSATESRPSMLSRRLRISVDRAMLSLLCPVIHAENDQLIGLAGLINNHVGEFGDSQLARPRNFSLATKLWKLTKKIASCEDAIDDVLRCGRAIGRDVCLKSGNMPERFDREAHSHNYARLLFLSAST